MRGTDADGGAGDADLGRLGGSSRHPCDLGGVGGGPVGRVGVEIGPEADLGDIRPDRRRDGRTDGELTLNQRQDPGDVAHRIVGQLALIVAQEACDGIVSRRAGRRGRGAEGGRE